MSDIFHLSLSVSDLEESRRFYEDTCGARAGRIRDNWLDVWLFGAQITLYHRPEAVVPPPFQVGQHFGATVGWAFWQRFEQRIAGISVNFKLHPNVNERAGVAKMVFVDPDGYLIELKAYRNPASRLQQPDLAPFDPSN